MLLIPSLMRRLVRDRVHPSALPALHSCWSDGKGVGLRVAHTEREAETHVTSGDLTWMMLTGDRGRDLISNLSVIGFFSCQSTSGFVLFNSITSRVFLLLFFFCPWQCRMSGSLRCEPSRKSELWHAVENRPGGAVGGNNLPSVRWLAPYPLWILAKEKRKNSNK